MSKRRPSGEGMLRKMSSGTWEGRIVVGHKENGGPIFRYFYGSTQKELLDKLHQAIAKYQGADLTEGSNMALREWLDRWIVEYKEETLRPNTLRGYKSYIRNYVKPLMGDRQLEQITPGDIQQMYNSLKWRGKDNPNTVKGKGLSDTTLNRIHAMLHRALQDAEEAHLLAENPADKVANPRPNFKPKQILNNRQLDTFMKVIEEDSQWRDFFYLELTTGLRRGEICALKWEDFDVAARTLRVRRSAATRTDGKIDIGETKTDKGTWKILLPASTASVLKARKGNALTEWIFPNPVRPEEPINPGTAYNRMKTLLKRAGLPSIRFHDLRHTFATHALASGVDAKTLAGILGHTNASFTLDTYTHVTGDMQKRAAGIVGSFMADIFGEELKPWKESEKAAQVPSA